MIPANYVVIRYIADAARNEPLNVGVLAWTRDAHELAISGEAVARIVKENPRLHPDALRSLEYVVAEALSLDPTLPGGEIRERIAEHGNYPVMFSEPRQTTLAAADHEALSATVERLVDRIVKPGRRYGGGGLDLRRMLNAQLKPLLRAGTVRADYLFRSTSSGVERSVDFFANSGANVAIDTVQMNLKSAKEIRLRADAEAFKVEDIIGKNAVRMIVVATFPESEDLAVAADEARRIVRSTTADLVESPQEAMTRLSSGTRSQALPAATEKR